MALTEAIIVMAHKLWLKVIAEGMEPEGQSKLPLAAGCAYAQGYRSRLPRRSLNGCWSAWAGDRCIYLR